MNSRTWKAWWTPCQPVTSSSKKAITFALGCMARLRPSCPDAERIPDRPAAPGLDRSAGHDHDPGADGQRAGTAAGPTKRPNTPHSPSERSPGPPGSRRTAGLPRTAPGARSSPASTAWRRSGSRCCSCCCPRSAAGCGGSGRSASRWRRRPPSAAPSPGRSSPGPAAHREPGLDLREVRLHIPFADRHDALSDQRASTCGGVRQDMPPLTTVDPPTHRPSANSTEGRPSANPPPPSRYRVRSARTLSAVNDSGGVVAAFLDQDDVDAGVGQFGGHRRSPAPDPTITAPHSASRAPVTSHSCQPGLARHRLTLRRADLRPYLQAAPGHLGDVRAGRSRSPLGLGQLVVAHDHQALQPLARVPSRPRAAARASRRRRPGRRAARSAARGRGYRRAPWSTARNAAAQRPPGRGPQRAEHQLELGQHPRRSVLCPHLRGADDRANGATTCRAGAPSRQAGGARNLATITPAA